MENGLAEIHLISLPSEVASLKLVDTPGHPPTKPQKPNLGNLSGNRTPSPAKRCQDFTFIDDGAVSSSSSATSTKEREKPRHCSEDIENHQCSNRGSHVALDKCPSEVQQIPSVHVPDARTPSDVCEMTPAPTRRLPTVVVLGYQRAVAESQAAAERLHQEQLRQGDGKASLDCPLTLSIGSGGLVNHGISPSPHGRNNRVKCSPSEDLHILPQVLQPPPPQSSPTHDLNFPPSATVTFSSPATVEETSSDERLLVDQPSTMAAPSNSPLSSSPPDVGPLWQVVGTRHVAEDAESIAESVYHQPPKAADRGAAYRLARRLFTLDGFKITDVAKHLCKRNDFSQLVGEEFASFFDFTEQSLDTALRYFMTKLSLTGETQERERIFFHFSRRYVACNPGAFVSDDACHTLVCALILLNTDLHNQNVTRKVTCQDFVSSLMELNNGENAYSPDELIRLYEAFKQEPLRWPVIEVPTFNLMYGAPPMGAVPSMLPAGVYGFGVNGVAANGLGFVSPAPSSASPAGVPSAPQPPGTPFWPATDAAVVATWAGCNGPGSGGGVGGLFRPTASAPQQGVVPASLNSSAPPPESVDLLRLFANQFADMPKDLVAKEYMRGFVMRKCVMESHGKRTAIGKRSWKLFYARLRDLMLYLYKDAETAAAATRAEEMALGYMKQVYRFHLQCQHLRLYHEHQQRLQPALPPGSDTKEEPEGVVDANESSQDGSPGQPPTALENASPGQSASKDACHTPPPLPPVESSTSAAAHSPPLPSNGVTVPGDLEQHHQQQQQLNATAAAPTAFQMPPPPEAVICVAHAYACVADDYVKKPNVCRLKTKDGSEYLMQVNDGKELEYWVDKINYVAGLLSAPALPCPLASDHTFQRPVLPADITHLGVHEQLEGHQKRILDLTRDLTELKRRRMSAPSQPNLTYLSRDSAAPSPAPSVKSESAASDVDREACQRLQQQQQPPTSQMPYIPDSVLKSLQPSSAAASGLAPHQSERTLTSTFSTASLGRRRKKSFNALRGGTGSELAAQRAELDERVAYLEHELTRYKTYSRLLETELNRLQRLPQHPQSAQIALYTSPQIRGLGVGGGFYPAPAWQVCGPPAPQELPEETSSDAGASSSSPSPPVGVVASLPPPASKRSYGPTSPYVVGGGGGMRQPRSHRAQFRQYQLQRQQHRQQFYNSVSTPRQLRPAPQQSHTEETEGAASPDRETPPAPFYEVL